MSDHRYPQPWSFTTGPVAFIVSPWQNGRGRNQRYLRRIFAHCFTNKIIPVAPHAFLPRYLNDAEDYERDIGMQCGNQILRRCDMVLVFADYGITPGMNSDIKFAAANRIKVDWEYILTRTRN